MQPKPIETRDDIEFMVRTFYGKVMEDAILAPHFAHVNWDTHMPRMIQFWSFILLDTEGFTGNVFEKHVHLDIGKEHFARWLTLFHDTVNTHFTGAKANEANQRADLLGYTFSTKMEQLKK